MANSSCEENAECFCEFPRRKRIPALQQQHFNVRPSAGEEETLTRIIADTRYDRIIRERAEARKAFAARWNGWRVFAIDIVPAEDGLSRVNVFVDPATGPASSGMYNFSFLVDIEGRMSTRLSSLLDACGLTGTVDPVAVEGRYFAARDNGRTADDFGPLSLALQAAA